MVNQAPALGAKMDCNQALSRTFVACERRSLSDFILTFPEFIFEFSYLHLAIQQDNLC